MDELPNFISIPLFVIVLVISIVCIITPVRFVQILFLWPLAIKHLFGINFPAGGDEILSSVYEDPSGYKMKYKGQMELVRIMGFIGIVISIAVLCKSLSL